MRHRRMRRGGRRPSPVPWRSRASRRWRVTEITWRRRWWTRGLCPTRSLRSSTPSTRGCARRRRRWRARSRQKPPSSRRQWRQTGVSPRWCRTFAWSAASSALYSPRRRWGSSPTSAHRSRRRQWVWTRAGAWWRPWSAPRTETRRLPRRGPWGAWLGTGRSRRRRWLGRAQSRCCSRLTSTPWCLTRCATDPRRPSRRSSGTAVTWLSSSRWCRTRRPR
mmetsp:Transcript_29214/g.72945  ORF Transcript_29214/g.72945 Transcript_29214/m.72945 type:complete len:220 (-) Transcript_29214:337-996(-)